MRLSTLIPKATRIVSGRGHKLIWSQVYGRPATTDKPSCFSKSAICRHCGMEVHLRETDGDVPATMSMTGDALDNVCPYAN